MADAKTYTKQGEDQTGCRVGQALMNLGAPLAGVLWRRSVVEQFAPLHLFNVAFLRLLVGGFILFISRNIDANRHCLELPRGIFLLKPEPLFLLVARPCRFFFRGKDFARSLWFIGVF